jgi:hypothetical protein
MLPDPASISSRASRNGALQKEKAGTARFAHPAQNISAWYATNEHYPRKGCLRHRAWGCQGRT